MQIKFFLLLNVNDCQLSSLQVVGDHSAIIMGLVLLVYLCNLFIKQQLVHDERKFIILLSSDVETCIYKTVLMIIKADHIAECIMKLNKYISLKLI